MQKRLILPFLFSIIFITSFIGIFNVERTEKYNFSEENVELTDEISEEKAENIFNSIEEYENIIINPEIINKWKIKIPKINLEAEIKSGTTPEILDQFVGHFEETQKENGNIGLAAHNRGYRVNYFNKIKNLEIGDEIYYSYYGMEKIYIVNSKNIINDTDWKWLENTKDNRITLITCVENKPKNRLCIQGIEKIN